MELEQRLVDAAIAQLNTRFPSGGGVDASLSLGIFRMLSLMPSGLADTMKAALDNAALAKK